MPVESVIIGLVVVIAAAEPEVDESDSAPDIELLEFLGSWETAAGEWIDPTVWTEEPDIAVEPQQEEKHE